MGIITEIPAEQKRFIARQAGKILSTKEKQAENILRRIVGVFKEKRYGWNEAIMDRSWYRYPAEVKNMRFCSEEALKNYLLCRYLGIPARYFLVENYEDTGLFHELVLAEIDGERYLLDWELHTISKVESDGFCCIDGDKIPFNSLIELPEDEIAERILKLRTGETFMDALVSGQCLFRKYHKKGILEGYVKYDPERSVLTFTYCLLSFSGINEFYVKIVYGEEGIEKEEAGIVEDKNCLNMDLIPLARYDNRADAFSRYPIDGGFLRREYWWRIFAHVWGDWHRAYTKHCYGPRGVRDYYRFLMKEAGNEQKSEDDQSGELGLYRRLLPKTPEGALLFMDGVMVLGYFKNSFKDLDAIKNFTKEKLNLRFRRHAINAWMKISMRDLGQALICDNELGAQHVIIETLGQKIGTRFKYEHPRLFDRLEEWAPKQLW